MAATRIVQNTVQLPGTNRPYALRNVSIRLNVPSFIDGGVTEKIRTTTVTTDSTGTWSAVLEVNADIDPANTYYTVREASGVVWTIVVPAGDPAVPVNLFDCLVDAPTNPTPIIAPDVGPLTAGLAAEVAARTAAIAALPSVYVAFVGGSGATDAGPYFQALIDTGVTDIHLKPNTNYTVQTPVFFDNTNPRARLTFHMHGSVITVDRSAGTLPKASSFLSPDTRWFLFDNVLRSGLSGSTVDSSSGTSKASGSSNPSKGRVVFQDGIIDGLATDVGLVYGHTSSTILRRVVLYRIKWGHSWSNYSDSPELDSVHVVAPVTGGWALKQENPGDGVRVSHCKGVGAGIWHAIGCNSGKIVGGVAGGYQFQSCKSIVAEAGHQELDEAGAFGTTFTVDRTQLTLISHFAFLGKGVSRYVLNINDTSSDTYSASDVSIDGGLFAYYLRSTETDPSRDPSIYINSANSNTRLRVRHLRTVVNAQLEGASPRFREGVWIDSADSGIASAVAAGADQLATGNFDLVRRDGAWLIRPPFGAPAAARSIAAPSVTAAADANALGTLSNGTSYQYVVAAKTAIGYTALSSTSSGTAGSAGTVALSLTSTSGDCVIAIWRKTGAGVTTTPDHYIEIPLTGYQTYWYDTGTHLNGRTWQTSSVPVPTTVAAAAAVPSRLDGMALGSGESTMDRRDAASGSSALSSGSCRFTYFVAKKTELVTKVRAITGSTAAAGLTLARIGVYTVDGLGNLTLVASTPNDATLFAAANTAYQKALSASFTKAEGQLYAIGLLVVGTTPPAILADALSTGASQFTTVYPPIVTGLGSQSDLPSTVAVGSLSAQTAPMYVELLP